MERIYQMNVVPDVIPVLKPSFDLRITFPEPPPESVYLRTRVKRRYTAVEPGIYLVNGQVCMRVFVYSVPRLIHKICSIDQETSSAVHDSISYASRDVYAVDGRSWYVYIIKIN